MKYQYDFSIIIPVYNNELYIDECLKSILKQKYPQEKIQVICVNDGSTDNSKGKLEKYRRYKNFLIINKENTGVSDTRNIGMKNATGKYIMFLDSDDFISNNACRLIYKTFEKYYSEADLLTYPLYRYNNKTKKKKIVLRFKSYDGTDLYNLEEKYYLFNPTMNVVIKNKFESNPKFDTNFFFHEDEQFVANVVYEKKKIIYLEEVKYYYRTHDTSTTSLKSKPYYSYSQYMKLYEEFIEKYSKAGKMIKYIQYSIFNDIKWRVKSKSFFPEYLNDEEYSKEIKRIKKIFNSIDSDLIYKDKNLSIYYILYFLKNFKDSSKIKVEIKDGIYKIYYDKNLIFVNNSIELTIHNFKILKEKNKLDICFSFKTPFYEFVNYDLYEVIKYKNKTIENKLEYKNLSYTNTGRETKLSIVQYIEKKYELNNIQNISYYLKYKEEIIPTRFIFTNNIPFNSSLKRYIIKNNKNELILAKQNKELRLYNFNGLNFLNKEPIKKCNSSEKIEFRKFNIKTDLIPLTKIYWRMFKKSPKSFLYRITIKQKKNTWLYVDQYDQLEEAYIQFLHDSKINDGIKKYYATSNKIVKGKYIVKRNSNKFKNLTLTSNKIITSHFSLGEYKCSIKNPAYFSDKLSRELIFINNKDLKYKTIKEIRKFESKIDKIIVSNKEEKKEYINNYFYLPEDIYVCGYPSYDEIKPRSNKHNKILFYVNWRKDLIKKYNPLVLNTDNLLDNKMYIMLKEIMTSKELQKLLKDNNIIMEISFNYLIKEVEKKFQKFENSEIKIVNEPNIDDYKLLITDTSNIVVKYLRTKNPIIYYQYNEEYFRDNSHIFKDLTQDDNFIYGPTVTTNKDLIAEIEKIIKNDYKTEKKYQKNILNNQVKVKNCQDEIYKAIKEVKK